MKPEILKLIEENIRHTLHDTGRKKELSELGFHLLKNSGQQ